MSARETITAIVSSLEGRAQNYVSVGDTRTDKKKKNADG